MHSPLYQKCILGCKAARARARQAEPRHAERENEERKGTPAKGRTKDIPACKKKSIRVQAYPSARRDTTRLWHVRHTPSQVYRERHRRTSVEPPRPTASRRLTSPPIAGNVLPRGRCTSATRHIEIATAGEGAGGHVDPPVQCPRAAMRWRGRYTGGTRWRPSCATGVSPSIPQREAGPGRVAPRGHTVGGVGHLRGREGSRVQTGPVGVAISNSLLHTVSVLCT